MYSNLLLPKASLVSPDLDLDKRGLEVLHALNVPSDLDLDYLDLERAAPHKRAMACMRGCLKMSSLHPAQCNSLC